MSEKITAETILSELAPAFEYIQMVMELAEKQIPVTGEVKEMLEQKAKEAGFVKVDKDSV